MTGFCLKHVCTLKLLAKLVDSVFCHSVVKLLHPLITSTTFSVKYTCIWPFGIQMCPEIFNRAYFNFQKINKKRKRKRFIFHKFYDSYTYDKVMSSEFMQSKMLEGEKAKERR